MKLALTSAVLIAAALAVPEVRSWAAQLLARAGRATNVRYVPAPDCR